MVQARKLRDRGWDEAQGQEKVNTQIKLVKPPHSSSAFYSTTLFRILNDDFDIINYMSEDSCYHSTTEVP